MTTSLPSFDVSQLIGWPFRALTLAPSQLTQPITYNINAFNSSAPQTEARIVSQHSYGRQLGRLSDAVQALMDVLYPEGAPDGPNGPLARFAQLREDIEMLKANGAEDRLERVAQDLKTLRDSDPDRFERVRKMLSQTLRD
ncbi:hypothetical protein [Roseateles sp. L2-2]|uniref:hypothetical protein n=1 Tax=Roseateles TaxID=93681 RepID=UPI000B4D9025|nr:hypothetical protein CDL60_25735 [Roseateles noduli]